MIGIKITKTFDDGTQEIKEIGKVSKSRRKATKKWEQNNKEHASYLKSRASARSFIRNKATQEDLCELKIMINEKLETIDNK